MRMSTEVPSSSRQTRPSIVSSGSARAAERASTPTWTVASRSSSAGELGREGVPDGAVGTGDEHRERRRGRHSRPSHVHQLGITKESRVNATTAITSPVKIMADWGTSPVA
jgi:hypothetical protein